MVVVVVVVVAVVVAAAVVVVATGWVEWRVASGSGECGVEVGMVG
jgi:hypothetical protein